MVTDKTTVRIGMSLDDYLSEASDKPFEIINGERIYKMPPMSLHAWVLRTLFRLFDSFVIQHGLGEVITECTYITPDSYDSNWVKGSRVPDLMFYSRQRIDPYFQQYPDWRERPMLLVPDLVIEVLSPTDTFMHTDVKAILDLDNGVKLVWLIDPNNRKAWVYTPEDIRPHVFGADGILTAEAILPNFSLELAKVWA